MPISSELQTKDWRKEQEWYNNGKQNESEKHQLFEIFQITLRNPSKTNKRILMGDDEVKIVDKRNPLSEENGFEYTENFDGYLNVNDKDMYFNLKFVCDQGGAQTRTLREVYHFIKHQIKYALQKRNNTYFFNILDGDGCFKTKDKFKYLIKNYSEEDIDYLNKYIYIGDMFNFQNFWNQL